MLPKRYNSILYTVKSAGFKPIGVGEFYGEDIFIFETQKEADDAYEKFERMNPYSIVAWWYGKKDFEKDVKEMGMMGKIYWL